MKTKRIYRRGFAALALILALAACADPVRPETGETIPQGMGLARIRLGAGEGAQSVVRTVLPGIGGYYFTLEFTAPGKTTVNRTLDGVMSVAVVLEPAVWTLEVKGYTNSSMTVLKVRGSISVPVIAGTESNFDVYLTPDFSSGGTGTLNYNISFPASVRAVFGLYPIDDTLGTSHEIDISASAGGTAAGTLPDLPEGSYMTVIELYDGAGNRAAVRTEAAHIYDGITTTLTRSFAATDFAACPPVITGTTLAARLDAALTSPSGSYTIVLDGTEGDLAAFTPKTLNVTDGKNITITIRGGGNEIQVDRTGTRLFTLGAAAGSSLSLTIQDLTLKGRSGNSVPVVQVNQRGTLLVKAGSIITGNTSSSGGGGVYVSSGGTFSMIGGAVSGNTSSSSYSSPGGSGVYVSSGGIFSMIGGTVNGNTSSSSYGGGVYVDDNGTFTMSGGTISANTVSYHGGGVFVNKGTFTMNGGAISGNSASNGGGGVTVSLGTLTMNSGTISGNSAATYGGGVAVDSGILTMNGGTISGNSALYSSWTFSGGGVCVNNMGTFTMSGGTISGNSTTNNGGGGGVLCGGPFTMTGGTISGNSAADSGGGVLCGGPFTMSGGTISGNSASNGGGVYVASGGTFTKQSGGVIYGSNESNSVLKNTAIDGDNYGHAVRAYGSPTKIRNTTAGTGVTMDSTKGGTAGGWE